MLKETIRGYEELEHDCKRVNIEDEEAVEELLEEIQTAFRSAVITKIQDLELNEILSDRM